MNGGHSDSKYKLSRNMDGRTGRKDGWKKGIYGRWMMQG